MVSRCPDNLPPHDTTHSVSFLQWSETAGCVIRPVKPVTAMMRLDMGAQLIPPLAAVAKLKAVCFTM